MGAVGKGWERDVEVAQLAGAPTAAGSTQSAREGTAVLLLDFSSVPGLAMEAAWPPRLCQVASERRPKG